MVRIEVPEGSTAAVSGPAYLRIVGGTPTTVSIGGTAIDSPKIEVADGETADITGPVTVRVTSDVPGSVLIDGEPVDPGAPVPDVAPVISSLSPSTAVAGDASDVTLIVTGDGYLPNSILMFGGLDEPTTFVSPTEVSTIVKCSLFVNPDDVAVNVRNGSAISNELTFTFTATSQRSKTGAKDAEAKAQGSKEGHQGKVTQQAEEKKA
jgi:hypothetical protein